MMAIYSAALSGMPKLGRSLKQGHPPFLLKKIHPCPGTRETSPMGIKNRFEIMYQPGQQFPTTKIVDSRF